MPPQLPAPATHAELRVRLRQPIRSGSSLCRGVTTPKTSFELWRNFDAAARMLKRRNGPSAAVGGGCGFKALKQDQSFKLSRVLINHPFKAFNCSSRSRFVMNSRLVNPLFVGFNQSSQSRFAKRTSAELFDPSQVAVPRADPWKARAHCSLILNDSWSRSMDSWCRVILAVSSPQRRTREIIAVLIHPSSIAIPGADPMVWKQFRGAVAEIDPLPSPPPQPHFSHILRLLFITEVSSMLFNPLCIFFLVNTTVSGYALEHSRFLEDEISLELKEEDGECYRMLRSRERSYNGNAKIAKLLLGCDLLKCGVDVNAISRVLLQSCKPSLHTNGYYRDEGRKIKAHIERRNLELNIQYCFKVVVHTEFRRDWGEALRMYDDAYHALRDIICTSTRLPPIQCVVEIKTIAKQLNFNWQAMAMAAASLAYGSEKKNNEITLVFDLGGGTFDVSVIEVGDGVFEMLSTSGDTHLGGDDFDKRIGDWLASNFKEDEGIDLLELLLKLNGQQELLEFQSH